MRSLILLACLMSSAAAEPPVRALIFSGRNNHDWRTTTPYLKKLLLDSGRFDVRVEEEPAGASARTLAAYDVLVLDYNGPRWGETTEQAVETFVRSGKGLVAVHGASYAFGTMELLGDRHRRTGLFEKPWPAYSRMVGGHWSAEEPKSGHGQRHVFPVKFVDRQHPIVAGLGETLLASDELYHNMRMEPDVHVLATAYDAPERGGTGRDEPLLWTVRFGEGRVFQTALGHDVAAMTEPAFALPFVRGAEWAATGTVTRPAKAPAGPRLLVVTGGHEYETSFYSLFTGYSWTHAVSNEAAFKKDIRPDYDVLVLYDLEQDLSENARKNLREFVEGGRGLVVLHHAIADYTAWPWWYREVVGGKYLLKAEEGLPASTYKHDQELIVRPVAQHPVVAGIGEFHLVDETYKGMWISPAVQVLLKTDHPTSDGPVAWISPYTKSRVVFIQLGHDHAAHQHPTYRALVANAITWAARTPQ
ncbi:MAG TPA: ThuA domain-containing protein [Bryobacteraceae bacterium]|nr:ThuA domain-containing protein [Bryobacteraceae bacterium]